jgi:hypothetical protein
MKVNIGPYQSWWSSTRLEQWCKERLGYGKYMYLMGDRESRTPLPVTIIDNVGDFLQGVLNYTVNPMFELIGRRTKVVIDDYDIWDMDHTLSLIIVPMLHKLKADNTGTPGVWVEDIPSWMLLDAYDEAIKDSLGKSEYPDQLHSNLAWKWLLSEMIFAFEQKTKPWNESRDGRLYDMYDRGDISKANWLLLNAANEQRIQRGHELFGKYLQSMWT